MNNIFNTLNPINVNGHTEEKNGLTYLSWSWAWAEVKKIYPTATYIIERFGEENKPYLYDENLGYMVFTSMTIEGLTHNMWLPVMDSNNKAMKNVPYTYQVKKWNNKTKQSELIEKKCEAATMFDVNKAIMRCLVKNIGMFGLGLYIYAGEDLPEEDKEAKEKETEEKRAMLEKEYIDIRRELSNIGVNYREDKKTIDYILQKANVKTQDNAKLNDIEMDRLVKVYKAVYEAKKSAKEKTDNELEMLLKENVQLKDTMSKQGIDYTSQLAEIGILQKAKVGTQDIGMLDEACIKRLNEVYKTMILAGGII